MNRKIQKLRREIAEIEDAFYGATDGDPENVYFFLKLKIKEEIMALRRR